jgi:peptide/nickel transport system permease protein
MASVVLSDFKKSNELFKDPRFILSGLILLVFTICSLFAHKLALFDPESINLSQRLSRPSWEHPFGCDIYGRDLFTLVLFGAQQTFIIVFTSVTLSTLVGIFMGILAGYFRGLTETVIMRMIDILMAFPGILLAMSLSSFLGPSINNVIFAISATGWTSTARLVRAQVLSIREREHVTAALSLGARNSRILIKHILPFLWTPLLVSCTFSLSGVILIEASLSFLGLGANSSIPTWGGLLFQGRGVLEEAPFLSVIPGVLIATVILSFNFIGDILRDVFDPKQKTSL